ncbi:hypothetical protein [Flavobacterium sp.]|uniref:hypothetical protein n=1 Tax=Flavobacterium sp. TaxID=239 RepID=UPI0037536032
MVLDRVEELLEKYFEGETSIAEENELKVYFSSLDVAQHLKQYQTIFGYFSQAKEQQFTQEIPVQTKKRNIVMWISIAASVVVMLGVGTFMFTKYNEQTTNLSEYGTYEDPEKALEETQRALALVSKHLNTGIESVSYINEYENSKNKIFKK